MQIENFKIIIQILELFLTVCLFHKECFLQFLILI